MVGLVEFGLDVDRVGPLGPLDTPRVMHEHDDQRMPSEKQKNRIHGKRKQSRKAAWCDLPLDCCIPVALVERYHILRDVFILMFLWRQGWGEVGVGS